MVDVIGINHFTWFTKASYKDMDLFPVYQNFIERNFEEGYHDPDRNWMNGTFNCAHRVKFDFVPQVWSGCILPRRDIWQSLCLGRCI